MKRTFFTLLVFVFLGYSCQDFVDADELLDTEEQIYINGLLSPQNDTVQISVARTLPSIGVLFDVNDAQTDIDRFVVSDAEVILSDGSGNSTELIFSEMRRTYIVPATQFPIVAGERYFLEVNAEGKSLSATCTVPLQQITEIRERVLIRQPGIGDETPGLTVSFDDIPNEENFYIVGTLLDVGGEFPFSTSLGFGLNAFVTDNIGDGEVLSTSTDFFPIFNFENETMVLEEQELTFQVAQVEEILFQQLRSQFLNRDNEGNPFAEVAIAPDNIEGGLGVFSGYQLITKSLVLTEEVP